MRRMSNDTSGFPRSLNVSVPKNKTVLNYTKNVWIDGALLFRCFLGMQINPLTLNINLHIL